MKVYEINDLYFNDNHEFGLSRNDFESQGYRFMPTFIDGRLCLIICYEGRSYCVINGRRIEVDGDWYHLLERNTIRCRRCDNRTTNDRYCDECLEHAQPCDDCGSPCFNHHRVWRDGETVRLCHVCYRESSAMYCDVHRRYEVGTHVLPVGNLWTCEEGRDRVRECSSCGRLTVLEPEGVCAMCKVARCDALELMRSRRDIPYNYGFKPQVRFVDGDGWSWEDDGRLFLGIELELDAPDEEDADRSTFSYDIHRGHHGNLYCKNDGSLEYGVEVVTQAFESWFALGYDWDTVFDTAEECGLFGGMSTSGMHVHINRKHLGSVDAIERLIKMVDDAYDAIAKATGRSYDQLEHYARRNHITSRYLYDNNNDDRYYAVNLENRDTVEIRLFGSPATPEAMRCTIDLCQALVECAVNEEDARDLVYVIEHYGMDKSALSAFVGRE